MSLKLSYVTQQISIVMLLKISYILLAIMVTRGV